MSKHSPLPFWIDDDHFIASGKNDKYLTVADPHASNDIDPCEIEANAEFIVKAVNCHYELVEALKNLLEWGNDSEDFNDEPVLVNAINAIKKAEA